MNNIVLSGKVWTPETKYVNSGMCITEMSLSVFEGKDKQTQENKYFSIKVKMFDKLAENVANTINKSDNVVVTGRLQEEKWEDKETGAKRQKFVLIADSVSKEISRFAQDGQVKHAMAVTANKKADDDVNSFGTDVSDEEIPF